MKFKQIGKPPEEGVTTSVKLGNVYRAKGKSQAGARHWVAIGGNADKALTMLAGIDADMAVISVAAYATTKVEGMECVGVCADIPQFKGTIRWSA